MSIQETMSGEFVTLDAMIACHATSRGAHPAVKCDQRVCTYGQLNALMDRAAAALQRDGLQAGATIALCAASSIEYCAIFFWALRAGMIVAPLAPSATPASLLAQVQDCGAKILFLDAPVGAAMAEVLDDLSTPLVTLDGSSEGEPFEGWLASSAARPAPVEIKPAQAFNIIYSSGTTGVPKGIVQSHAMRWAHMRSDAYDADAVTLASTPLYSNTTLVSVLPTFARGGAVVLLPKFDAERFLELSREHRVTHAMLVPVQYRRLLALPKFGAFDLSSYRQKFSTSAPLSAELKEEILRRWPGGLTELYGMTEGGGTCVLHCHEHPGKLHTVGRPAPGHDIRLIDDVGIELPAGEVGEVVGRSDTMMNGYHNHPAKTAEAEWRSPDGLRFIRTGDIGRFDEDGYLTLMDRKKDLIISGGFNVYPSDLEAEILEHGAVLEAAVVGVASHRWGETPVAFVALKHGARTTSSDLMSWVNGKLGKTQRLADLQVVDSLPRSHIGKVLKKELRESYVGPASGA